MVSCEALVAKTRTLLQLVKQPVKRHEQTTYHDICQSPLQHHFIEPIRCAISTNGERSWNLAVISKCVSSQCDDMSSIARRQTDRYIHILASRSYAYSFTGTLSNNKANGFCVGCASWLNSCVGSHSMICRWSASNGYIGGDGGAWLEDVGCGPGDRVCIYPGLASDISDSEISKI